MAIESADQNSDEHDLEMTLQSLPDRFLADVLVGKDSFVPFFKDDGSIQLSETHSLPLYHPSFLQAIRIRGLDEPVHILYDYLGSTPCGIQMGTIVNTPVHRGVLLYPSVDSQTISLIPLQLCREQRWSYFTPLHALLQREIENSKRSKLTSGMLGTADRLTFNVDISTPSRRRLMNALAVFVFVAGGPGGIASAGSVSRAGVNLVSFTLTYPRYTIVAPVGDKTVIVASECATQSERISAPSSGLTSRCECPACKGEYVYRKESVRSDMTVLCQNCGKPITVNPELLLSKDDSLPEVPAFPVPSKPTVKRLVSTLVHLSKFTSMDSSSVPVESKVPEMGTLFKILTRSASGDLVSSPQSLLQVLQNRTSWAWKQLPNTRPASYEISTEPPADTVAASRYAPQLVKCSKCGALRSVSASTMPSDGRVKCHNCGVDFLASNYIGS